MRLDADSIEFQEFLLELGDGKLNSNLDNSIRIPDQYIIKPCHPKSLCDSIYANFDQNFSSLNYNEWVTEKCIICSNYNQVDIYNNIMIDSINNNLVEILSIDESVPTNESNSMLPIDFLNSLEAPGLPSHKLKLKVGIACIN